MPVLTVFGQRFQISSDFVPFLAVLGFFTHVIYFIIFGVIFLISKPGSCSSEGSATTKHYVAVLDGTLAIFGATMVIEIILFFIGIRGTPFQESKRRWMTPMLSVRAIVWILQAAFNVYATVIVELPDTPTCFNYHDRDVDLRVMVYMTWGFIFFNWVRVYFVYILFPDYQDAQSWRRHARIMVFGCFKNKSKRDIKEQLSKEGKKPLKRTTRVFSNMLKPLDLSPTDQVVGIILLGALQRRRRGIHISALLRPDAQPRHTSPAELQAAHGTALGLTGQDFEGRMERALTVAPSTQGDIAAVLENLRDTRPALESALATVPEAATEVATQGAQATVQNGVLTETATRVLETARSIQKGEVGQLADPSQAIGSSPVASDQELAAAMGTAATLSPIHVGNDGSARRSMPPAHIPATSAQQNDASDLLEHSASDASSDMRLRDARDVLRLYGGAAELETSSGTPTSSMQLGSESAATPESPRHLQDVPGPHDFAGHDTQSSMPSPRPPIQQQPINGVMAPAGAFGQTQAGPSLPDQSPPAFDGIHHEPGAISEVPSITDRYLSKKSNKGLRLPFKSISLAHSSKEKSERSHESSQSDQLSPRQASTDVDDEDQQHEQVLAEALAETSPELAVLAAQAELETRSPEQPHPTLEALRKITSQTQSHSTSGYNGHAAEKAVDSVPTPPSPLEQPSEGVQSPLPPSDEAGGVISEEAQAARTAAAGATAAAEEALRTVEATGMNQSDGLHSKSDVRSVAKAAVNLVEAQLGAALTSIQEKVVSAHNTDEKSPGVGYQIALSNLDTFLTPSSIAAELRPDLSPAEAANIYTGPHKQVDRNTTLEARIFAKYATAVYGTSFAVWLSGSNKYVTWAKLLYSRGWNAYKVNELNASRIKTLSEHLDYEAIVQYSGVDDSDLLYFSYTNQALGVLPYIVVLDQATKSVVVSIRGSASTADWVTDFMGVPENAADWIPDSFREEHPELGRCTAHSGMLAAAAAVWADLNEHGILSTLLNPPEEDSNHADQNGEIAGSKGAKMQQQGGGHVGRDHSSTKPWNATHTSGNSHSDSEYCPCDVQPESSAVSNDADAAVEGPEDLRSKSRQLKNDAKLDEHGRGPYVAAIMKRGLHKQGWKLVVTGHSLGAGVAALISLKLRHSFPEVKCWAFCPPGGLVSANLSAAMAPWCTSVICGKDAISRISLPNLATMIDETLIAVARCKQPTCQVLLNTARKSKRAQTIDQLLFAPEEVPPEALKRLHHYQSLRPQQQETLLPMLPPGRAMFLRRLKAKVNRREARARKRAAAIAAAKEQREQRKAAKIRRLAMKREREALAAQEAAAARAQGVGLGARRRSTALRNSLDEGARAANDKIRRVMGRTRTAEIAVEHYSMEGISSEPTTAAADESRQPKGRESPAQSSGTLMSEVALAQQSDDTAVARGPGLSSGPEGHTDGPGRHERMASAHSREGRAPVGKSRLGRADNAAVHSGEGLAQADQHVAGASPVAVSPFANSGPPLDDPLEEHQAQHMAQTQLSGQCLVSRTASGRPIRYASDAASLASVLSSDTEGDIRIDVGSETETEDGIVDESHQWLYERLWDAVWIHPKEVVDEGILISPRMTSDHYTTSLIGALQAVLAGGKETGTLEQQAGGVQPVASHTPIDRLKSLAGVSNSEILSASSPSKGKRTADEEQAVRGARSTGLSSFSKKAKASGPSASNGSSGLLPSPELFQRKSGSNQGTQGGRARNAVIDILPG